MQKKIDLSDFIFDEVKIKHDAKIDPNAKLKNFSNIRISLIDEKLKGEISGLIQNIRKNLSSLSALSADNSRLGR